jgi:hypothetical protein
LPVMTSNLARRIVPGETVIFAGAGLGLHRRSVVCQDANAGHRHCLPGSGQGLAPSLTTNALKRTHPCPISFARPYLVLASRVYGSPSNGFRLAPSPSPTAQITRGCLAPSAISRCGRTSLRPRRLAQ